MSERGKQRTISLGKEEGTMVDWIVKALQGIAYITIAVYNTIRIWKEIHKKD